MKSKMLFLLMLGAFIFCACSGSSLVVLKKELPTKPYKVSFFFGKASDSDLNTTYEFKNFNSQDLLGSLFHSFNEDDQANLMQSTLQSIENSKPFANMLFAKTKIELDQMESDYEVLMLYAGASVSTGNWPSAKIAVAVVIKDKKTKNIIFKNVYVNEDSSGISLGRAKNGAITKTINSIIASLDNIK